MTQPRAVGASLIGLGVMLAQLAVAKEPPGVLAPTIRGPQYFAVLVSDANRSAEWYKKAFGLRELDRSSADDGSWQIVNLSRDELFVEVIRDNRAQPAARVTGFFKVGFHVPDVNAVAAAVERTTGERPRVIDVPKHRVRIVQIKDPDGNTIQLFSRLGR